MKKFLVLLLLIFAQVAAQDIRVHIVASDLSIVPQDYFRELTKEALKMWDKHSSIDFILTDSQPDVIIRADRLDRGVMGYFDGSSREGGEIVIANDKYLDHHKVFYTLVHEIGHLLGLKHSKDPESIMRANGYIKWPGIDIPAVDLKTLRKIES